MVVGIGRPTTALLAAFVALLCAASASAPALAATTPVPATAPTASFTTSPATLYVAHPVTFDASGSAAVAPNTITSYQWTFGDGTTETSSSATTTHVYATTGSFKATLTVTDSAATPSGPVSHTLKIVADKPLAKFTFSPSHPEVGKDVTFNGSGSKDPDGDALATYTWNFGDGHTQTTSTPIVTHAFAAIGSFTVTLTVADAAGNTSAAVSHPVAVSAVPVAPKAAFTFAPSHPVIGQTVSFDAAGSTVTGATIVKYLWSFDDGTPGVFTTIPTITHAYTRRGTFDVRLVVYDSQGLRSSTVGHFVAVLPPAPPAISRLRLKTCWRRRCHPRQLKLHFALSVADTVTLAIRRQGGHMIVKRVTVSAPAGTSDLVTIRLPHLPRGRYVLSASAGGGNSTSAAFHWRRR